MPIYEFHCLACGRAFEKLVLRPSATVGPVCPGCASPDVARTLSVFGVRAGSGVTDAPRGGSGGGGCCGPGGCGCR